MIPIDLKRNGSWFILLSIFATGLLTNAKSVQNNPNFCNQALKVRSYTLVPDEASNKDHQESIFYEFAYGLEVSDVSCVIASSHTLKIGFDRITKVSDILIRDTTFDIDAIKVSLWRGTTSFECKFSGSFIKISTGRFARFSCLNNDAYNSTGLAGDAIEIATYQHAISVDLKNMKKEGSFGWLYVMQRLTGNAHNQQEKCPTPGLYPGQRLKPEKQFYSRGENVTFVCPEGSVVESVDAQRNCLGNGVWSDSTPKCQAKRQWYNSFAAFDHRVLPVSKENVTVVASFNRDFFTITEISVDFEVEFDESEWERYFMDNNNAIFYILDSQNNILKKGPLPRVKHSSPKWNSITVSAKNFVQEPCTNCIVGITFRKYHWQVPVVKEIRAFGSTIPHSDTSLVSDEKMYCSPITPYIGMPVKYKNYELITKGSINDLLLTSPCRDGFKFVGKRSEINQCRDGTWQGSGFPICEATRVKSPVEVEHASWVYVHGNGHHEIIYICENGYHVTGEGKATYSIEKDAWIDVPECQQATFLYTMRENWLIFLIVGLFAVIGIAASIRRMKQNLGAYSWPSSLQYMAKGLSIRYRRTNHNVNEDVRDSLQS